MIIPSGVNHLSFYETAKVKGVKITSRFIGVSFNLNYGKPSWVTKCLVDGSYKFLGRFPFTEQGEKEAGEKYKVYMENNNLSFRYSSKRKYRKKLNNK